MELIGGTKFKIFGLFYLGSIFELKFILEFTLNGINRKSYKHSVCNYYERQFRRAVTDY